MSEKEKDTRFNRMHFDPKFLPIDGRVSTKDKRFNRLLKPDFSFLGDRESQKEASKSALKDLYKFQGVQKDEKENEEQPIVVNEEPDENVITVVDDADEETFDIQFEKRTVEIPINVNVEVDNIDDEGIPLLQELNEYQKENRAFDIIQHALCGVDEAPDKVVQESTRFAVVNHDFNVVNIEDLFVLFQSMCSDIGACLGISQYYSKFGEKAIPKDIRSAPKLDEIFHDSGTLSHLKEQKRKEMEAAMMQMEEGDQREPSKHKKLKKAKCKLTKKEKVDMNKVAMYELEKLKYFIAVVEFSSPKAMQRVYDICNGVDFEDTQMYLDLQVIPTEKKFNEYLIARPPVKKEDMDLDSYKPIHRGRSTLYNPTNGFQWDMQEQSRSNALSGNDDIPEEEILKYVNLSESDSEDEEELEKIRQILLSTNDDEVEEEGEDGDEEERNEMEGMTIQVYDTVENVEIQNQLNELLLDRKKAKKETYHETRKRRKLEEKKKKRKEMRRIQMEEEENINEENTDDEEIELDRLRDLIKKNDDGEDRFEYDLKVERQREMQRVESGKNEGRDTGFKVDMTSGRFEKLLKDPEFNIDPTNKKFKKTKNYEMIIAEKRKRRLEDDDDGLVDRISQKKKRRKME